MNQDGLNPEGDLPPNHPLVLEALKGIISGPISELRTKVDNLITSPSNTLKKGEIDYAKILPINGAPVQPTTDYTSQIANNVLNRIASEQTPVINVQQPQAVQTFVEPYKPSVDPNQMELPLFKPTEISDIYKKLFDIEGKLDTLIRHVKSSQNKKQG
jgi:hypothetical protein